MEISVRSQLPLSSEIKLAFLEHTCTHRVSYDNFKIITKTTNTDQRQLEALYIHKIKQNLNEDLSIYLNIF